MYTAHIYVVPQLFSHGKDPAVFSRSHAKLFHDHHGWMSFAAGMSQGEGQGRGESSGIKRCEPSQFVCAKRSCIQVFDNHKRITSILAVHTTGSPGMIRQLDIRTWFMTLSAADLQWPDAIQTVAHQYGASLSDEQVSNILG